MTHISTSSDEIQIFRLSRSTQYTGAYHVLQELNDECFPYLFTFPLHQAQRKEKKNLYVLTLQEWDSSRQSF